MCVWERERERERERSYQSSSLLFVLSWIFLFFCVYSIYVVDIHHGIKSLDIEGDYVEKSKNWKINLYLVYNVA